MARDDWKHYEEMGDEEAEEGAPLPKEKMCPNCLHAVPVEAPYCAWCGKPFPEPRKKPARKE